MQEMRDVQNQELTWIQPSRKVRSYELRAGDAPVLTVRWEKKSGPAAIAESAAGQWSLSKSSVLRTRVAIRAVGSETDFATFRGSWDGGGVLETRDGRRYEWNNTNLLHTAWVWTDRSERPLLRFKGKHMTVEPAGASVPEISLLAALSWYLDVMARRDDPGSIAGIVAATSVVG